MRRYLAGLVGALAAVSILAGCSGESESSSSDSGAALEAPAPVAEDAAAGSLGGDTADTGRATATNNSATLGVDALREPAIIRQGQVVLRSDAPGEVRDKVRSVITSVSGEIVEEQTESDKAGELTYAALTARVPSTDFDDTIARLEQAGIKVSSNTNSQDVTTEVVDVEARIRAQTAGLERIEQLLLRAQNLPQIIAIENQLTQRQAELDSLKSRQAWLANQTSMSTINVTITKSSKSDNPNTSENALVRGLKGGWTALTNSLEALLVVVGALLPFAILFVILCLPLAWIWRRSRAVVHPKAQVPVTHESAQGEG
jgi:hypothetical protein